MPQATMHKSCAERIYLMQRLCHHLCELVDDNQSSECDGHFHVDADMVECAEQRALRDYKKHVLDSVLRGTNGATRTYLSVAHEVRRPDGTIFVDDISARYQRTAREMAGVRDDALGTQVITRTGYGCLRFALPHCRFLFEELERDDEAPPSNQWDS